MTLQINPRWWYLHSTISHMLLNTIFASVWNTYATYEKNPSKPPDVTVDVKICAKFQNFFIAKSNPNAFGEVDQVQIYCSFIAKSWLVIPPQLSHKRTWGIDRLLMLAPTNKVLLAVHMWGIHIWHPGQHHSPSHMATEPSNKWCNSHSKTVQQQMRHSYIN